MKYASVEQRSYESVPPLPVLRFSLSPTHILIRLLISLIFLQRRIRETFAAFDVNQDGHIDMMELRGVLSRMGEIPSEKQLQVGVGPTFRP